MVNILKYTKYTIIKFQENLLFFLVFVLFLPDYLRYPLFAFLMVICTNEFIKYKDIKYKHYLLIIAYLTINACIHQNFLGMGMSILFLGLLPYAAAIKRRITIENFDKLQYYVVWSSLFNFPFIYIYYRPQWYLNIENYLISILDIDHLPTWRLGPYPETYHRAYSTFDNPNFYAFILLLVLTVCTNQFQKALTSRKIEDIVFYFCAFIINGYALILTETRTLLVALLVSIVAIVVLRKRWNQLKFIIMLGCLVMAYLIINPDLLPRLLDIQSHLGIRIGIWENALITFENNPLWGSGLMTYALYFDTTHAHNLYFEMMISFGMVGIILMIIFVIFVINRYYRDADYQTFPVFFAIIIGTLVFGVLEFPFYYLQTTYLFTILLCLPDYKKII